MSINLMTPLGYTGYGVAGLNILKSLAASGSRVSLFPIGPQHLDSSADTDIVAEAVKNAESSNENDPTLKIWHQFALEERVGKGKYTAYPFFELNRFNDTEISQIRIPDQIFVTCEWAKKIVEQYRDNVKVVPLGIDPTIFYPRPKPESKTFVVANFGKWEKRKGHDVLVEIFNRAFTHKDNVQLWMFPNNPFLTPPQVKQWETDYLQSDLGYKIKIHGRITTHAKLASYMAKTDLGIFPSRAEGWNLELLEMMAMGKPVITTNYSAHTEYCDKDNAMLVDIEKEESAFDGKWFFNQGDWAHLGEEQIDWFVDVLRTSYMVWKSTPDIFSNQNGVETGKRLTWANTADIIKKNLE